jgi:hypothetical protein
MSQGSNIKAAPAALTPDVVGSVIEWLNTPSVKPEIIGVNLATKPDEAVEIAFLDGRIISFRKVF